MTMPHRRYFVFAFLAAALLVGCAHQAPPIDSQKLGTVRSVAIVDIPRMRYAAHLGVLVTVHRHFKPDLDPFFIEDPAGAVPVIGQVPNMEGVVNAQLFSSPKPPSVGAAVGGSITAALIESSAKRTLEEAQGFNDEVVKRLPNVDFREDFMKALRSELQAKGLAVQMVEDQSARAPRLRWPATTSNGFVRTLPASPIDAFPAVDADILMQVSPIAFYGAPGPLNSWRRHANVAVALFNGRTKEFVGFQSLTFNLPWSETNQFKYTTYAELVNDIPSAMAGLRAGLLSLAPTVAGVVVGQKPQ